MHTLGALVTGLVLSFFSTSALYWSWNLVRGAIVMEFGIYHGIESVLIASLCLFPIIFILKFLAMNLHAGSLFWQISAWRVYVNATLWWRAKTESERSKRMRLTAFYFVEIPFIFVGSFVGTFAALWTAPSSVGTVLGTPYSNPMYNMVRHVAISTFVSTFVVLAAALIQVKDKSAEPMMTSYASEGAAFTSPSGAGYNGSGRGTKRKWTAAPSILFAVVVTAAYFSSAPITGGGGLFFFDTLAMGAAQYTFACSSFNHHPALVPPDAIHAHCRGEITFDSMQTVFQDCVKESLSPCHDYLWWHAEPDRFSYCWPDDTSPWCNQNWTLCVGNCSTGWDGFDPNCNPGCLHRHCDPACLTSTPDARFAFYWPHFACVHDCLVNSGQPIDCARQCPVIWLRLLIGYPYLNITDRDRWGSQCGWIDFENVTGGFSEMQHCAFDHKTSSLIRCRMPDTLRHDYEDLAPSVVKERVGRFCWRHTQSHFQYVLGVIGRRFSLPWNPAFVESDVDGVLSLTTAGGQMYRIFGGDGWYFLIPAPLSSVFAFVIFYIAIMAASIPRFGMMSGTKRE